MFLTLNNIIVSTYKADWFFVLHGNEVILQKDEATLHHAHILLSF